MTWPAELLALAALLGPSVPSLAAQAVDTVRVGSPSLLGAAPEPGTFVIESFRRENDVDTPISTTRQTVRAGRLGEVNAWFVETEHRSDDTTRSSIAVRADDLSLVHHRVKASRDSAAVSATHDYLTGWVVLPEEPVRLLDLELQHPVFPVEGQIPWLFPLLPLAEGYTAAIPHFSQWDGGESWTEIRVLGREAIELNGRSRDCWRVDGGELFPGYRVTYWVDPETRRVVRGIARSDTAEGPEYWSRLVEMEPD